MRPMRALVRRPGPHLAGGIVTHIERVPVDLPLGLPPVGRVRRRARVGRAGTIIEVPPGRRLPRRRVRRGHGRDVPQRGRHHPARAPTAASPRSSSVEKVVESLGCSINRIARARHPRRRRRPQGRRHRLRRARRADQRRRHPRSCGRSSARSAPRVVAVPAHQGAAPQVGRDRAARRHGHRLPAARRRPAASSPGSCRCPRSRAPTSCCSASDRLLMAADCSAHAPRCSPTSATEPVTVDISEFEKLEGCVTCLSVRLRW